MKIVADPKCRGSGDDKAEGALENVGEDVVPDNLALEALERNEILVEMDPQELTPRLVDLYRTARADVLEGGANTLFLVLGFLVWNREDRGNREFRAPLVLIPVSLHRRSVRSGVRMVLHEDEPRFNTTLLTMLRQDFGLDIQGLDESLPVNDAVVDVIDVWDRIRSEIAGFGGFRVVEDLVVGTFSFAKYLMWKDLVDRTDRLAENRVVRHLIQGQRQRYVSEGEFPDPMRLDEEFPPHTLLTALPMDSSQLSAVAACASGKDFVLVGPPGTGKSQTIANMIAHALADGRTVLFVSEKIAALDVVYTRLKNAGLGEFCLELHSNRARKVEVLEQLHSAWSARERLDEARWGREARRLEEIRGKLNIFVKRIHRRHRNGLTPFLALGQVIRDLGQPCVVLEWSDVHAHDEIALDRLRDIARRLDVRAAEAGRVYASPLEVITQPDWSPEWQKSLLECTSELAESILEVRERIAAFFGALRICERRLKLDQLRALKLLVLSLPKTQVRKVNFALGNDALDRVSRLDTGLRLLRSYRRLEKLLASRLSDPSSDVTESALPTKRWQEFCASWWPPSASARRKVRNSMMAQGGLTGRSDYGHELLLLWELQSVKTKLEALGDLADYVPGWRGLDTDLVAMEGNLHLAKSLLYALAEFSTDDRSLVEIHSAVRELMKDGGELLGIRSPVGRVCGALSQSLGRLEAAIDNFSALAGDSVYAGVRDREGEAWLDTLAVAVEGVAAKASQLNAWCGWRRVRAEALRQGLGPLVAALEKGDVAPGRVLRCFETSYCRWWISAVVDGDDVLREFHAAERRDDINAFCELDDCFLELTRRYIRARLCAALPGRGHSEETAELSTLRRELEKKTRHKALRQLIGEIPSALTQLTPCLLMSPLSVAQYLSPDQRPFDLVIFDEASQITVWDAIGAIARGHQTVVVGDPKQLPPTSFFSRADDESESDEDVEGDLESILEECLGAGLPARDLKWHYRSEHESLIAFSNHRYYDGNLITFPSPYTYDRSVRCVHLADAVYGRGGTRTNRVEAKAVVAEVVSRLKSSDPEISAKSIGVVTFNVEQQRLIEDLLDEERLSDPGIEQFFSDHRFEGLFVKNLESVQGDERDVVLFSVTFGPDADGHVSMNFGPLNRDGGERRLNVAVTRARSELLVFTSLRSEQINLTRARGAGVRDFKHFLEFAERGPKALMESIYGSVGEYGSPFESAIARSLSERGWVVHPQVGVSAFKVGVCVVHPDSPGRYLAGIECDGETYGLSATARDRDKLREALLQRVGWDLVRVWSLDWWIDAERAAERLNDALIALLEKSREEEEAKQAAAAREKLRRESGTVAGDEKGTANSWDGHGPSGAPAFSDDVKEHTRLHQSADNDRMSAYKIWEPDEDVCVVDANEFFSGACDDAVQSIIDRIVSAEGPVRDDVLVKRVVRVHGFKRTGRKLRDRVLDLASSRFGMTSDSGGVFFWPDGALPEQWRLFRAPISEDDFRSASEICFEELAVLARRILTEGAEDPAREMALAIGLSRIDSGTRRRLEDVLAQVADQLSVDDAR